MTLRNALMILMFPALMVATGVALTVAQLRVPFSLGAMLAYAPYFIAILAAIVGGWFKSPRMVLMAILIGGAHWVVQAFVAGVNIHERGPEITVIYAGLAVLFPLNAALVALKTDRGLLSVAVLSRVLFVVLQIVAIIVVWDAGESARALTDDLLHTRMFDKDLDYWSLLPQPALMLFALVGVGLLARAVWRGSVLDGGLFGAVVVTALALHAAGDGPLSSILFSLAAIVLLAALGQESYRLAYIDELTGLPGRRALMHDLMALSGDYTVAMLDVDHFKKFNDTYGHDVGDQVLKMVAGQMMRVTGGGRSYRYGGEEFTVLFARKDINSAVAHLDKLRKAIEGSSFKLRAEDRPKAKPEKIKTKKAPENETVSVTVSIGAAPHQDGVGAKDVLKTADQALYRAKDGGRNQVSQ